MLTFAIVFGILGCHLSLCSCYSDSKSYFYLL